jgi:hypothetical protein
MEKGKEGEGMKAKGIPVIARYYEGGEGERIPCLFFPSLPANRGNVQCWQWYGEHGEASIEFYRACKPMEKEEAEILVKKYRSLYPHEEGEFYTIKQKVKSSQLREEAWKRGN